MNNGSISTNTQNNSKINFAWQIQNQNMKTNTTTIYYEVRAQRTKTGFVMMGPVTATIDGNKIVDVTNRFEGYNNTLIANGTYTLEHNTNGYCTFNVSISGAIYSYSINVSANGDFELDRINRKAEITGAPNWNDEENPTITFSNPANLSVRVFLNCNGQEIFSQDVSSTINNYTINLNNNQRNLLRSFAENTNTINTEFGIGTYINGVITYTSEITRVLTIINAQPEFEDFDFYDIDAKTLSITNDNSIIIEKKSNIEVAIENYMTTKKYATPKSYQINCDGKIKNSNYTNNQIITNIGTIDGTNQKKLEVIAFDSRNNSAKVTKTFNVIPYDSPKIQLKANRTNNFDAITKVQISGTFSQLIIDDEAKNEILQISLTYVEINGEDNGTKEVSFSIENDKIIVEDFYLILNQTSEYRLTLTVRDKLSTTTTNTIVQNGQAIFFISSNQKKAYVNGKEIAVVEDYPKIKSRTKILNFANSKETTLFNFNELKELYGIDKANIYDFIILVNNGDTTMGNASDRLFVGYNPSLQAMRIISDTQIANYIRVNYMILYSPSTIYERTLADGKYYIKTLLDTNKVVEVSDQSTEKGANVQIFGKHETPYLCQQVFITYDNEGYYKIKFMHSNYLLDVQNGYTTDHTNVWQYTDNGTDAQKWAIVETESNQYKIISKNSKKYLTVANVNAQNCTNIEICSELDNDSQTFIFEKIEE